MFGTFGRSRAGLDHAVPAGVAVGDQHGVAPARRELPTRAVGNGDLGQHVAVLQPEVAEGEGRVLGVAHAGSLRFW